METVCLVSLHFDMVNQHYQVASIMNLMINGIGTGLSIRGTLNCSFTNNDKDEINLHIKDALYDSSAPIGLLHQQAKIPSL
jgi:hypothetical protein